MRSAVGIPVLQGREDVKACQSFNQKVFSAPKRNQMETRKTQVADLIGPALDWMVAKCDNHDEGWLMRQLENPNPETRAIPRFSTEWAAGGPVVVEARICIDQPDDLRVVSDCQAFIRVCVTGAARKPHYVQNGPTPLVAACRCYVHSRLGSEVEVPAQLLG